MIVCLFTLLPLAAQKSPVGIVSVQDSVKGFQFGVFSSVAADGGYGYNWAFGKRSQWLLHVSAMPTFVVYQHHKLTVNGEEKRDGRASFNMIFNERAAVVCHFSPCYHAGASFMMSNSVFDNSNIVVNQNKWLARAFVGVRL